MVEKQQLSPKVDEMKVLSEKEIREFLANENKDVVDAGTDAEDNEIGASAESFCESPAARARVKVPRKVESRKPRAGNASPIMVGPPPPMAAKNAFLRSGRMLSALSTMTCTRMSGRMHRMAQTMIGVAEKWTDCGPHSPWRPRYLPYFVSCKHGGPAKTTRRHQRGRVWRQP